ncbi:MAG: sugar ABC transporter permease [Chloroflexota bacterium]|nr:sugar ABC transporter permease [Chloroflexota bacterium]
MPNRPVDDKGFTPVMALARQFIRQYAFPYLLLAPSLLAIGLIALYPFLQTIWTSLHRASLILPDSTFIGPGNFRRLIQDDGFWNAWTNTLYFTVVTVLFETILGFAIATALNRDFRGRALVRAAVLIPWAIPTVVSSRLWGLIFNTDAGLANYLLTSTRIMSADQNWLGNPSLAINVAAIVDIWKTTPFMALILLAGLQTIPGELYEAAAIDGASFLDRLLHITLPMIAPVLLVAMLLRTLDAFRVFDVIYVMTGGGPADSTEVLSTLTYKVFFSATQFGYGSALAVAMFVSVLLLSAGFLFFLRNKLEVG